MRRFLTSIDTGRQNCDYKSVIELIVTREYKWNWNTSNVTLLQHFGQIKRTRPKDVALKKSLERKKSVKKIYNRQNKIYRKRIALHENNSIRFSSANLICIHFLECKTLLNLILKNHDFFKISILKICTPIFWHNKFVIKNTTKMTLLFFLSKQSHYKVTR